jgi:uncharacterized protein YigE (DUF2233 family)
MQKILVLILLILALWAGWFGWKSHLAQPVSTVSDRPSSLDILPSLFPTVTPTPLQTEWVELASGISVRHLPYTYNDQMYPIQVIRIDPSQATFLLKYNAQGKTIRSWAEDSPNTIIVNAGFFKEKNQPVGLLYIKGQRLDAHRIQQNGTGLLKLDQNRVSIQDLGKESLSGSEKFTNALQAYPMLLSAGNVRVLSQSTAQDRRTAIGVDGDGMVYLFVAEYAHLGLFEFANLLKDAPLSLTEVLNLDGGGSTGLVVPFDAYKKTIDSQTAVPTVLVVEPK